MWQRFSERARKTIFYAQEEAQNFGEGYVSTEHILLGLLHESDNVAVRIISMLGQAPDPIREEVRKHLVHSETRSPVDMTLTPRAKRVIDLAYDEARNLNNNYIGTEHLLLGLIREQDGLAGRILERFGIDLGRARKAILQLQDQESDRKFRPDPPPPLRHRTVDLKVRYDIQVLHPVDQMLVALLSDPENALGERLRQACTSLDWLLPSIIGTMMNGPGTGRGTLEQVVGEGISDLEELYQACLRHTSNEVRAVLRGLDLAPEEEQG